MRIELPSGTAAELVHPPSGPAGRGLVVIPDVMGMRPLFDDLVARLAAETAWSVAAFELYPGREHLEVADRLAAASTLDDDRVLGDASAAAAPTPPSANSSTDVDAAAASASSSASTIPAS